MGQTLTLTNEMKDSRLYRLLQGAETVCFVGDSLTEGTINGGVPWLENAATVPLVRLPSGDGYEIPVQVVENGEEDHEEDEVHLLPEHPFEAALQVAGDKAARKPRRYRGVWRALKLLHQPARDEEVVEEPHEHRRERGDAALGADKQVDGLDDAGRRTTRASPRARGCRTRRRQAGRRSRRCRRGIPRRGWCCGRRARRIRRAG